MAYYFFFPDDFGLRSAVIQKTFHTKTASDLYRRRRLFFAFSVFPFGLLCVMLFTLFIDVFFYWHFYAGRGGGGGGI